MRSQTRAEGQVLVQQQWINGSPGHMPKQLVFPGHVGVQSRMHDLHFTMNCCWVHLTLGACGSDSTQFMMRLAASDCVVI